MAFNISLQEQPCGFQLVFLDQRIASDPAAAPIPAAPHQPDASRFFVGVTSFPTSIAHTFMAVEALKKAAQALGYEMKVETQGLVGAQNTLTFDEIGQADTVIIAADAFVDKTRFAGKRLYEVYIKEVLHGGQEVIQKALALPEPMDGDLAAFHPLGGIWIGFVRLALTYGFNFEYKKPTLILIE
jgi:fructose-specific phosphotransferase system IIB component